MIQHLGKQVLVNGAHYADAATPEAAAKIAAALGARDSIADYLEARARKLRGHAERGDSGWATTLQRAWAAQGDCPAHGDQRREPEGYEGGGRMEARRRGRDLLRSGRAGGSRGHRAGAGDQPLFTR